MKTQTVIYRLGILGILILVAWLFPATATAALVIGGCLLVWWTLSE